MSMKIAFVGCGAGGSVFASYLRKGGADITLVDFNKAHLDAIAGKGMTFVIYPDETYQLTGFQTATSCKDIGIMDAVVFMTKANQLEAAAESALPCVGPDTVLVSLINGIGNDDKLKKFYPEDRIIIGSGVIGTQLDGPGKCIAFWHPNEVIMNFGALVNSELTDRVGKHLEKCFNDGGCWAVYREDILPFIWYKVIKNASKNTVCAVLRMPIGPVHDDPYGRALFDQVIREGCAVAECKGVHIDADQYCIDDRKHVLRDYYPSMAQDVIWKKLQTEVDVLNGAISQYGKEFNIPTPTNDILTQIVCAIQNNYDKQYDAKCIEKK